MGTVNSYLVKEDEPTLIDCGEDTDESWKSLISQLADENLTIKDIKRLIITHAHVDHIGMAQRVAKASNCEVWVSDKVKPWAIDLNRLWEDRINIMKDSMGQFLSEEIGSGILSMFQTMSQNIKKQWKTIDEHRLTIFNHANDTVPIGGEYWEVIYAPGHSITQSCFYNKRTLQLFSADMLLKITPTPVMEVNPEDSSVREKSILTMLRSYEKFRNLPTSMVYPGHYEIFDDPIAKIDQQINRIHSRKEECFDLIASGTSDLVAIFQTMYKGRWHLPAFNMTIAYIDMLEHENRILLSPNEVGPVSIYVKPN